MRTAKCQANWPAVNRVTIWQVKAGFMPQGDGRTRHFAGAIAVQPAGGIG
ncbi:hypothetical protein [Tabrizicola sp.]